MSRFSWLSLETGGAYHSKAPAEALVCPVCGKPKGEAIHGECAKLRKPGRHDRTCTHAADVPVDPKAVYLTVLEVAAMAGCSGTRVRKAIASGELVALRGRNFRPGSRSRDGYSLYVVHPDAARAWVEAWLARHDNTDGGAT